MASVVQKLYLKALPTGLHLNITSVRATVPTSSKGLTAEFSRANGIPIAKNGSPELFPSPVGPHINEGLIGTVKLGGSLISSGAGGTVFITFSLEGQASVNGKLITISNTGSIQVTTSEWRAVRGPATTYIAISTSKNNPLKPVKPSEIKNPTPNQVKPSEIPVPSRGPNPGANFEIVQTGTGNDANWTLQPISHFED